MEHQVDFSIIEKLGKEPKYAAQKDEYVVKLAPKTVSQVKGDILTATVMDAHNTFEEPHLVHPDAFEGASLKGGTLLLTLPAKSVVVLTVQ